MKWPIELVNAFVNAITLEPKDVVSREQFVQLLLDGAAAKAVKIASGDPSKLECAYTTPYTPVGEVSAYLPFELKLNLTMNGHLWCAAVDKLYEFVRSNATEIIECQK